MKQPELQPSQDAPQSLKWFLIRRFVIIMVFIFISEELLNMLYRFIIAPFLSQTMHIELSGITAGDSNLLLLILKLLLISGASFLPDYMARLIQATVGKSLEADIGLGITSPLLEGVTNPVLIELYQIAVILIFLALLFVTLLPYIISAYWYYRTVSGKVRELLQLQREQKEEYDRQRNLL